MNQSNKPPRDKQRRGNRSKSTLDFLKEEEFIVEGEAALAEFFRFRPNRVLCVVCEDAVRERLCGIDQPKQVEWIDATTWENRHGEFVSKSGVWAIVRIVPLSESDLIGKIGNREKSVIIALDHVTDPRNLGAIARSCGFFGVKEIVVPKKRQVLLTNASVATSQGAFALTDLCVVTNLNRILEKMKDNGYWIVGADMDGEAIKEVAGFYEKVVLVFGAEGGGISDQVLKKCDRIVSIKGNDIRLESLNVSVAAGILLHGFQS